jgi:uncharacterized protein
MNRIIHFEIHAKDMDAMQTFYNEVFGWTMQDMGGEMGNYRTIMTGPMASDAANPGINGGMTPRQGELPKEGDAVNAYVCIISVSDTDNYVEKVLRLGGSLALPSMNVPTVGRLAYCKDPEGNLFGMLTPAPQSNPA